VVDRHWATVGLQQYRTRSVLLLAREATSWLKMRGLRATWNTPAAGHHPVIPLDPAVGSAARGRSACGLGYGVVRLGLGLAGFGRWV